MLPLRYREGLGGDAEKLPSQSTSDKSSITNESMSVISSMTHSSSGAESTSLV
jgi:hypothetical protein